MVLAWVSVPDEAVINFMTYCITRACPIADTGVARVRLQNQRTFVQETSHENYHSVVLACIDFRYIGLDPTVVSPAAI